MEVTIQQTMVDANPDNIQHTFGQKLDGVKYIDRVAVYGIATDDKGRVATVRTPTAYFLPGGGLEDGEDHAVCLHREFIEETGYRITIGEYIGCASLYHLSKYNRYLKGIGYFYSVCFERKCAEPEKGHQLTWLEPNECINSLVLEHQAWAVEKNMKGSKNLHRA